MKLSWKLGVFSVLVWWGTAFPASIGIYRGTFDPTHLGHLNLVESAEKTFSLHRVLLFVNANPRHKPGATAHHHRCAMAMLTFSQLPYMEFVDARDERWASNEQFRTFVEQHALEHPEDTFYLLNGDDTYEALFAPGGFGVPRGHNIRIAVSQRTGSGPIVNRDPDRTVFFTTIRNTSSTAIRRAFNQRVRPYLILPEVEAYIQDQFLYQPLEERRPTTSAAASSPPTPFPNVPHEG